MPRPLTSKIYEVSDEDFSKIVESAKSYADVLRACKIPYKGGNINTVKRRISLQKLSDDHIQKGWSSNKGRTFENQRISLDKTLKEVLIKNSKYSRRIVKSLILRYEIIPYKCKCGNEGLWNNEALTLQLEHKNGTPNDHSPKNLCFLCPNCHSQTDTYAGKSSRKKIYCLVG